MRTALTPEYKYDYLEGSWTAFPDSKTVKQQVPLGPTIPVHGLFTGTTVPGMDSFLWSKLHVSSEGDCLPYNLHATVGQWIVCQVGVEGSPRHVSDDFSPPSVYTAPSGTIKMPAIRKGVRR